MSDMADDAQAHIEREQGALLSRRMPSGPIATGRCLYCDEALGDDQRWCNRGCRDAYERVQRAAQS